MTLADTSAWIAFIRRTGSAANRRLREGIRERAILTTDPVVMEVLAGARDEAHWRTLGSFLAGASFAPVGGLATWEQASRIYRRCRSAGFTPRSQLDCLVAAVAIREEVPVLHADRDFDLIAEHTSLRVVGTD